MLEVEQVRPVTVRWHVMSLAILNEGRELPEEYRDWTKRAIGPVRVLTAAQIAYADACVLPLYTALGNEFHLAANKDFSDAIAKALSNLGLPTELADAATSTAHDESLRASHNAGMEPVGMDVGTPVIHVRGNQGRRWHSSALLSHLPSRGEAAGRLWDGTLLVASTPAFYEIKRSRAESPPFA